MQKLLFVGLAVFFILKTTPTQAAQSPVIDGQLIKPNGAALEDSNVSFRIQVRSPGAQNCLMYEEQRSLNMSGSGGNFRIDMGDGAGTRNDSTGLSLQRLFANRGAFTLASCASGSSYSPSSTDSRNVVVLFKDSTMASWESLPPMSFGAVPYAVQASQVGGFSSENLVRVVDAAGEPVAVGALTSSQYSSVVALANGTSIQYEGAGKLNGVAIPTLSTGRVLVWNGTGWSAEEVQPFAKTALPSCAAGQFLTANTPSTLTCVNLPSPVPASGTAYAPAYSFAGNLSSGLFSPDSNTVAISANGNQVLSANMNGNLGIGTSLPSNKLHLASPSNTNPLLIQYSRGGANSSFIGLDNLPSPNFSIRTGESIPITFGIFPDERLRIMPSSAFGVVGIGTSNPQGALHVESGAIVGSSNGFVATGGTFDFRHANVLYTNDSCGNFNATNLKPGTIYKLIVLGSSAGTCVFNLNSGGLNVHSLYAFTTTAGQKTMFTITVAANDAFVEMASFN